MESDSYVLITAVRDEEKHIAGTLNSVAGQTIPPKLWVICINDSKDKTHAIVRDFSRRFRFILPVELDLGGGRAFSNQAIAIREGFRRAGEVTSLFVGVLDGDVTFGGGYFAGLMNKFLQDPRLGIAAGRHIEYLSDGSRQALRTPPYITMGPSQFFRRKCFEEIGGHRPLKWGGQDTLAGVMARINGWNTAVFEDLEYEHHREMGSAGASAARARFLDGVRDQKLGMHPFYALAKCARRTGQKPRLLGSLCWLAGYWSGFVLVKDPEIPSKCRSFFRAEQLRRLRNGWFDSTTCGWCAK